MVLTEGAGGLRPNDGRVSAIPRNARRQVEIHLMVETMEPENLQTDWSGRRILIVDDDSISVRIIQNVLVADGCSDVRTAFSGRAGIEAIESESFDLILCDIVMPGIEGYEVCRKIRSSPEIADIPVVMVTGKDADSDESLVKSFQAGASDFIIKPIRPIELLARVRSALSMKAAKDRLRKELERRIAAEQEKQKTIEKLQKAIAEIRTLGGLLPICAACKKIRNDEGYWTQIETYISQHSAAEFSHGICPDCTQKYMAQLPGRTRDE